MRKASLIFSPVKVRQDREHGWKHHARPGLMREFLGYADLQAANHPQRFVFASRKAIMKACFKGPRKEGEHFTTRALDKVLAEVREQHIISRYFEAHDGQIGFIVAPHDSLCRNDGKMCVLPDRSSWSFHIEQPDWRGKLRDALVQSNVQRQCSQKFSDSAVKSSAKSSAAHVLNSSQLFSEKFSGAPFQESEFADLTDEQIADWFANGMQFGASNRGSRVSEEPRSREAEQPSIEQELEQHHHFLKRAEKRQKQKQQQKQDQNQQQKQDQNQQQERDSFSKGKTAEAKTAEAKPKKDSDGRYKPVLPSDEYKQAQWKAEMEKKGRELGFEPCNDGFNRVESDRILFGYTLKDENGIWHRPADWQPSEELKKWEAEHKQRNIHHSKHPNASQDLR